MIKLNRLKSLIWLRWQYLMSNKGLLYIGIGMPIGEMALLSLIPNIHGNAGFLSFSLNFVYSITSGSFISLMIGEEKEKKNLRTLILSGVKMKEYTFSVIIFPFIFSIISCIYFPLLFGVHISSWPVYIFIIVSECLFFILANLSIGLFSKNQVQASLFTLIIFIFVTLLPILLELTSNELIKNIIEWSFIGINTKYFIELEKFQISNISTISILLWIFGMSILTRYAFAWNRKDKYK